MTAGVYDLVADQGADFDLDFTWSIDDVPVNLTGFTALMQVRRQPSSPVLAEASTSGDALGDITLDAEGNVHIHWDAAVTATWTFTRAKYDIKIYDPVGVPERKLEGAFTCSKQITTVESSS